MVKLPYLVKKHEGDNNEKRYHVHPFRFPFRFGSRHLTSKFSGIASKVDEYAKICCCEQDHKDDLENVYHVSETYKIISTFHSSFVIQGSFHRNH